MCTSTTEAVVTWLLSADHVPQNLAARLHLPPPVVHSATAWRFRGRWTHTYRGELGQARPSHTVNVTERVNPDGTLEQVADGTTSTAQMSWSPVSGSHEGSFDVTVVEGPLPTPPGAGFAAKAAKGTVEAKGRPCPAGESWQGAGMQRVQDEAGLALRDHLGSPHVDRLEIDTRVELTHTERAPATLLEFVVQFEGAPLPLVLGPDGSVWGSPPRDEARKQALSSASAKVVLSAVGWVAATIVGLLAFVVPGLLAAVLGFFHVRSLSRKRDLQIEAWREQERPAVTALVRQTMAALPGG